MVSAFSLSLTWATVAAAVLSVAAVDIGPETCGQDRIILANW
jgi:hypothetical protein